MQRSSDTMTRYGNVEYVDGDGPPVVLLHGWLGSKQSWDRVRDHLDCDNPLLVYSQQGGQKDARAFSFEELADDVAQLCDEYGLDAPILVGHSMGGMVALTYAAQGHDLAGLVLIGTCADTPEPRIKSPKYFLDQMDVMDREEWAAMIADNYLPEQRGTELWRMAKQEMVDAPEYRLRNGLAAMVDYDIRDAVQERDVSAYVIAGERDQAITPEKSRELAEILDAETVWLDGSHLLLQEVPGEVAQHIEQGIELIGGEE